MTRVQICIVTLFLVFIVLAVASLVSLNVVAEIDRGPDPPIDKMIFAALWFLIPAAACSLILAVVTAFQFKKVSKLYRWIGLIPIAILVLGPFLLELSAVLTGALISNLAVTIRNSGSENIWIESAQLMGHDIGEGAVIPEGTRGTFLHGTGRMPNPSIAVVCWRPYLDSEVEPLCADVSISRDCLPKRYRQGRDELMFIVKGSELSLVVRMSDQALDSPGMPTPCSVSYRRRMVED